MTNTKQIFPAVCMQQDGGPLGAYGREILSNMRENYPERYWQLSFEGTLMEKIRAREQELAEQKLTLLTQLEQNDPRPRSDSFLAVANHMTRLAEEAEAAMADEIKKPV